MADQKLSRSVRCYTEGWSIHLLAHRLVFTLSLVLLGGITSVVGSFFLLTAPLVVISLLNSLSMPVRLELPNKIVAALEFASGMVSVSLVVPFCLHVIRARRRQSWHKLGAIYGALAGVCNSLILPVFLLSLPTKGLSIWWTLSYVVFLFFGIPAA